MLDQLVPTSERVVMGLDALVRPERRPVVVPVRPKDGRMAGPGRDHDGDGVMPERGLKGDGQGGMARDEVSVADGRVPHEGARSLETT